MDETSTLPRLCCHVCSALLLLSVCVAPDLARAQATIPIAEPDPQQATATPAQALETPEPPVEAPEQPIEAPEQPVEARETIGAAPERNDAGAGASTRASDSPEGAGVDHLGAGSTVSDTHKIVAYAFWGASGLSFAIGTYYGVTALQAKADFDERPSLALADRADTRSTVANIAIGVGLSFALIGALFYFKEPDADPDERAGYGGPRRLAFAPLVSPSVHGAAVKGSF